MRTTAMAVVLSLFAATVEAAPDYLPLKEGNQWVFMMSTGVQTATRVAGFANVGTVRCAIMETTMGWQKSVEYVATDAEGVKAYMGQMQGQEFRYDPPILRLKLPYREGDTWASIVDSSGMPMTASFESTGKERLKTPVGTFDCIKVRSTMSTVAGQPPAVSIIWYAAGVGPVRQVMQMAGQEITATLASTNVREGREPRATPKAPAADKIRCPKCGEEVGSNVKFCPQCGQKITASLATPEPERPTTSTAPATPTASAPATAPTAAAPVAAGQTALEKYQSPDGKVLLYKPRDWSVTPGDMFGPGTYGVIVMEPQENAVALFITFPVGPQVKDSVVLAAQCIAALRQKYPDLQATNINSTPQRERTITDLTLTAEGEKGTGHGYFFHNKNTGSVYILLGKTTRWNELRPTLTTIAANLAYAPQGVAAVQEQARQPASAATPAEGPTSSLVAILKRATEQPGKQVPLQAATLTDQSLSLQIPEGWTLEGAKVQYAAVNNAQTRTHGIGSLWLTIMPTNISIPGVINVTYQPPPEALKTVLESGKSTKDVQIICESPVEEAVPGLTQMIQQMQAQGSQVDARLIHAKFRNVPTGQTCRGIFCVICSIKSISPVWQVSLQGSWAPDQEYEEWLPLYLRIEKSVQVNQQWMGQEMQNQAIRQQQLNRNLQKSIAESNRAFDDYMKTVQDGSRSRDYISHMWSQTTLGQGTWVAENEGAKVYQTDSWGIEGPEGQIHSKAYNTANFTGENPWTGGKLELVDTRAEYERYIANPGP